jgi:hypothetical protein
MPFKNRSFSPFRCLAIFTLVLLLLSNAAITQTPKPSKDENFTPGTDVSLGLMGQMTFARNPTIFNVYPEWTVVNQQTQSQSPSAGALVTFHGAMKEYLGYNVNFGYTRFMQTDSEGVDAGLRLLRTAFEAVPHLWTTRRRRPVL